MATFDANLHEEAFLNMESGRKTVYTLLSTDEYAFISAGDRLEFGRFGSILVGMVRRYPCLEDLLEAQGYENVVPEATSTEDATRIIREVPEWNKELEEQVGVLALRVREAWRK